jgi:hypothetical protein
VCQTGCSQLGFRTLKVNLNWCARHIASAYAELPAFVSSPDENLSALYTKITWPSSRMSSVACALVVPPVARTLCGSMQHGA